MTTQQDLDLLALQLGLTHRIKKRAFFSTGNEVDKDRILPSARQLEDLGVEIFATEGTSAHLNKHGISNTLLHRISEGVGSDARQMLEAGLVNLVVNVLTGEKDIDERSDARIIRNLALEHGTPFYSDIETAVAAIDRMAKSIERDRKRAESGSPKSMAEYFAELVHDRGGYADNHGHYDKAYLITPETLALGQRDMQEKWRLYRELKAGYTPEDLFERILRCVEFRISCGVTHMRTMVDADTMVELKCIEVALAVKKHIQNKYGGRIVIEIGIQPLEGVLEPGPRKWVEKACGIADYIGGLPSRDAPRLESHLDVILGMAREQKKRFSVHVDQKGVSWEDETKLLALMTMKYGLQGFGSGIHAIISRKEPYEQREIARMCRDAGLAIEVCPGAAISMKQEEMKVQMSNSIAPVPLLHKEGVVIVLGSDNTQDPFMPFSDGDPWYETRLLADACRDYTAPQIADIVCNTSLFGGIAASH